MSAISIMIISTNPHPVFDGRQPTATRPGGYRWYKESTGELDKEEIQAICKKHYPLSDVDRLMPIAAAYIDDQGNEHAGTFTIPAAAMEEIRAANNMSV